MARILVVDDEAPFRGLLRDILEGAGHGVVEARDGLEALRYLERGAFELVVSDRRMPNLDGVGLLKRVQSLPSPPPVLLLTAYGTIPEAVEAIRLGATDYITKPLPSPEAFLETVHAALRKEVTNGEFVTGSDAMRDVLALVDRVAPRDVAVLITGESGTGKELVARRLHERSPRAPGPFVAVNCAALPESLAESELFGTEKGAFTGADQARSGRFEEASGGTLFLDEIGELPVGLQAKLLRVLEDRTARRLGGSRDLPVDIRLVAATNRDLLAESDRGSFRGDLYFRLAVVTIHLPPLRERPGDIAVLARHLLEVLASRHGIRETALSPDAVRALEAYRWPGNVRELRNVLERALIVRGDGTIGPDDLSLSNRAERGAAPQLSKELREREAIMEALRQSRGNREEAARLLGISVRTLYYRLRSFGLS